MCAKRQQVAALKFDFFKILSMMQLIPENKIIKLRVFKDGQISGDLT